MNLLLQLYNDKDFEKYISVTELFYAFVFLGKLLGLNRVSWRRETQQNYRAILVRVTQNKDNILIVHCYQLETEKSVIILTGLRSGVNRSRPEHHKTRLEVRLFPQILREHEIVLKSRHYVHLLFHREKANKVKVARCYKHSQKKVRPELEFLALQKCDTDRI